MSQLQLEFEEFRPQSRLQNKSLNTDREYHLHFHQIIMRTEWQHSEECMCRQQNKAMCDYQESVTTGQTQDKVIPMCRYASQSTQECPFWVDLPFYFQLFCNYK